MDAELKKDINACFGSVLHVGSYLEIIENRLVKVPCQFTARIFSIQH